MAIKDLPHNDELEQTILGIMMSSPKHCLEGIDLLNEEDFYAGNKANRLLFSLMKELTVKGEPVEITSLADALLKRGKLDEIGGIDKLVELTNNISNFSSLSYYAGLLKDYSLMCRLIDTVDVIRDEALKTNVDDFSQFVANAENRITRVTAERRIEGFKSSKEVTEEFENDIEINIKNPSGLSCGYTELDSKLNGLQRGNLIILAARPSVGKSALGLNMAFEAAKRSNRPVAFFSLEMASKELMKRLVACKSTVPMDRLNKPKSLTPDDKLKLKEAESIISRVPLYFDDTAAIGLDDLVAKAKKLKNDLGDLALVVVDYVGKVTVKLRTDNKNLEIDRVTGTLKKLARDLDIPVLALAQVNRKAEDNFEERPSLNNLRDSGAIEQDADQVMFIHNRTATQKKKGKNNQANDSVGKEDIPDATRPVINEDDKSDLVEIIIGKNRNGPLGTYFLMFFKAYQRFDEPSAEAKEQFYKFMND